MNARFKTSMFYVIIVPVFLCSFFTPSLAGAQPLINEVMASNTSTVQDAYGDYPDWIEIFNPGSSPIDLDGYGLSDDPDDPFKWVFPKYSLKANEYLLVFASDKDFSNIPGHWETVIKMGDDLKYTIGSAAINENWRSLEFDDSGWLSGPSGIGSQSGNATAVNKTVSLFIRKTFDVTDTALITHALLQIDYDDGFVAYINGAEIVRSNMDGAPGTFPSTDQLANTSRKMQIFKSGNPDVFEIHNIGSFLKQGVNVLSIEVHNKMKVFSDVSVIPFLTLGMTEEPPEPQGVPEIISFSVDSIALHTNFKVRLAGETLILSDASGVLCDSLQTGEILEDISRGRSPDGSETFAYFAEPTPGESNTTLAVSGYAGEVEVSVPGGLYTDGVSVEITSGPDTEVIRYTLDGAEPSDTSTEYTGAVSIDNTTVLRARAFKEGMYPGPINTNTYILNEDIELPIISISTTPKNLWDPEIGIYVRGNSTTRGGYPVQPTGMGNYCEDWERPIHIEFYEPDGTRGFSIDAGVKIVGKGSRGNPQKSLAIFARPKYGYDEIDYQIFPNLPTSSFKSLVLRAGGTEQTMERSTLFRGGLHQTIMQPLDVDVQGYRPSVVFLNGEYWGIHNIREKLNEDYLATYHGIDPDEVDILDDYHASFSESGILQEYTDGADVWTCFLVEGNTDHYHALLQYMMDNDESDPNVYEYLKTQIDMENLIDYISGQIFISNGDGPGHNCKIWRPQTENGKWRWLLYDTEFASGIMDGAFWNPGPQEEANYVNYYARENQESRCPDANFIMFSLLKNDEFKSTFINRYADHLNTIFSLEQVIPLVEEFAAAIESDMPRHITTHDFKVKSMDTWHVNVEGVKEFFELRYGFTRQHVVSEFGLGGMADVILDVSDPAAGTIQISSLTMSEFPWTGIYFQDVPIKLTAIPAPGYAFAGWTGVESAESAAISVTLSEAVSITANFVEDSSAQNAIVINEINYNSSAAFDPEDWIELYNAYDNSMDISGWTFTDSDETGSFSIPGGAIVPAGGYLVLARNAARFHALFPTVKNYVGDFGFGLNNAGEEIRLYNTLGGIVDSLTYDDVAPWPVEADGTGPTLALISPDSDNSVSGNWVYSTENGTPGIANDLLFSGIDESAETEAPSAFALGQNYPNPFNPVTTIPFSLPKSGRVTLSIYSVTGQRIAEILNDTLPAGYYQAVFSAGQLPSGMYFYRIEANGFSETKTMLLLK
jgi:hypothetical protein